MVSICPFSMWSHLDCHSCISLSSALSLSSSILVLLLNSAKISGDGISDITSMACFDIVLYGAITLKPIFLFLLTNKIHLFHPMCFVLTDAPYSMMLCKTIAKSFLLHVFAPPVFGIIRVSLLVASSALLVTMWAYSSKLIFLSKCSPRYLATFFDLIVWPRIVILIWLSFLFFSFFCEQYCSKYMWIASSIVVSSSLSNRVLSLFRLRFIGVIQSWISLLPLL